MSRHSARGQVKSRHKMKRRKNVPIDPAHVNRHHDYYKLFMAAAGARIARRKNGVGRPPAVNLKRIYDAWALPWEKMEKLPGFYK